MLNNIRKLSTLNLSRYFSIRSKSGCAFVEKLTSRSLIRIKGPDSGALLQGLITNDIEHLTRGATSMYTMMLNTGGRVLYEGIVYKANEENCFLIECDKEVELDLQKHLKMYKLRKKVDITSAGQEIDVFVGLNCSDIVNKQNLLVVVDPRVKNLGHRILGKVEDVSKIFKVTSDNGIEYRKIRYELGVAEGIAELIPGKALPLESNCDYLHGVSFFKGCYLGQELTARSHHTGVIRKRILPIQLNQKVESIENEKILNSGGKAVGVIRGTYENLGIGLLRIEDVLNSPDSFNVHGIECKTWQPDWWPKHAPAKEKAH